MFYRIEKDGKTGENGEKLDGHISDKEYLMWKKIWKEFGIKNMDDYHDHYLKKDVLLSADVLKSLLTCAWNLMGLILVIILVLLDWVGMRC